MSKRKCCKCCEPEPDSIDARFLATLEGKLFHRRDMKFRPVAGGIFVTVDGREQFVAFGNHLTVSIPLGVVFIE